MFIKHYAPNRCLYIKVAKLRTGVGSVTPTKSLSQNIRVDVNREVKFFFCFFFFFFFWGGGGSGRGEDVRGGSQGGCEQRIEVFVKIPKKKWGGGRGGWVGLGGQGGCERRIEVFVKIQKKIGGWGGEGGVGLGGQGGCDRRIEVFGKIPKTKFRGGGVGLGEFGLGVTVDVNEELQFL